MSETRPSEQAMTENERTVYLITCGTCPSDWGTCDAYSDESEAQRVADDANRPAVRRRWGGASTYVEELLLHDPHYYQLLAALSLAYRAMKTCRHDAGNYPMFDEALIEQAITAIKPFVDPNDP